MVLSKNRLFFLILLFILTLKFLHAEAYDLFNNFEDEKEWNISGNAETGSKFYYSIEEGPDSIDVFLGKLEYAFATPGNDYVEFSSPAELPKPVIKYRIWINGDKKEALLKIIFRDQNDEMLIIPVAKINWYGWKQIEGDINAELSAKGNEKKQYKFYGFLLEDDPDNQIISGTLLIKDLEFMYGSAVEEVKQPLETKEETETAENKKGVFFSGLASITYDDVDTQGPTNVNQHQEPWIRKSFLHQYFDLMIHGQLYDEASIDARIRIEKGNLGWVPDRKEDYYNENYSRNGAELEKMEIKGKPLGFKNTLTIGKINPYFNSYSLSKILYGAQWDVEKDFFKSSIVGARPESTVQDKGGLYNQNNNDYNVYLLGVRESFRIQTVQLSGSVVNVHRNAGQFSAPKNFLRGNNKAPGAASVYFKLSDNSPQDSFGGELIDIEFYEDHTLKYDIIPNNNEKDVLYEEYNGSANTGVWAGYRWTKNDAYFIYRFALSDNIQSVEILANLQNNYKVELSLDGINWYTLLVSPSDIQDQSNTGIRKIKISKSGAVLTDNDTGTGYINSGLNLNLKKAYEAYASSGKTILGLDLAGKIGETDVTLAYNTIYEHRIYIGDKRKDVNIGYATYLNLARQIEWASLKGEVFDITRDYNTGFSRINTVDDNDDRDEWPDNWKDEIVRFIDENKNGIPDNEERPPYQKLGIYILEEYFDPLIDNDNNEVRDDRQNDDLPDYQYKVNQIGYSLNGSFDVKKYISLLGGYKDIRAREGGSYDQEIMAGIEYTRSLRAKGDLKVINKCRSIRDTIPDDLVYYNDGLYYKNNVVNDLSAYLNYKFLQKLIVRSKAQYTINGSTYKKTIQNAESIIKLSREFPLVGKLYLTPVLFSRFNKDISSARSPETLNAVQVSRNMTDQRSILELAYKLSALSKIFLAGQYGYYKTFLFPVYKYYVSTFSIGAQGTDLGAVQYGIEYRREKFEYHTRGLADAYVSSFYAHVSYRF